MYADEFSVCTHVQKYTFCFTQLQLISEYSKVSFYQFVFLDNKTEIGNLS